MDLNFLLIVLLGAWVGVNEYRIYKLENKKE